MGEVEPPRRRLRPSRLRAVDVTFIVPLPTVGTMPLVRKGRRGSAVSGRLQREFGGAFTRIRKTFCIHRVKCFVAGNAIIFIYGDWPAIMSHGTTAFWTRNLSLAY